MAALTSPGVGITVNVSRRDSQEYLRLHQLEPYLEDAAVYALYAEDDLGPAERLRDYFRRVLTLEHIYHREYAYVSSTAWNRRAFVVAFRKCVHPLRDMDLTVADFHQLLIVICPDFPRATLDSIIHVLPRALQSEGKFHCGTLATAFEVHWYHSKFLSALDPFFRRLVRIDDGVAVPTGKEEGESSALPLEELERAVIYLNATKGRRPHPAAISWEVVEQCLADAGFRDAVSFRRLCQCLLQSEVLARRLHTPPLPMRSMDRVAAILAPPPKPSVPETTEEEPIAEEKPPPRKQRSLRKKVNSTMRLALAARKRENAERAAAAAAGAGGGADEE
jgi:hypothetical protein